MEVFVHAVVVLVVLTRKEQGDWIGACAAVEKRRLIEEVLLQFTVIKRSLLCGAVAGSREEIVGLYRAVVSQ